MRASDDPRRLLRDQGAANAYRAGLAALDQQDYQRAIDLLSLVIQRGGVPATLARHYLASAQRHAGLAAARQGRADAAVRHLSEARRLMPESGSLADQLAKAHAQLGETEKAIEILDAHVSAAGRSATTATIVRLALLQWRAGEHAKAVATIERAVLARPHEAELRVQLALFWADQGKYESALQHLDKASQLDPISLTVHYQRAMVLAALGRMPETAAAMRRVEHLRATGGVPPRTMRVKTRRSRRCLTATRIGDAITARRHGVGVADELASLIAREPEIIETFLDLPAAPAEKEVFHVLRDAVRMAAARHPAYADLRHYAARVWERLGDWPRAMSESEAALRINPHFRQAWIHGGRLLTRLERYDDARARFEQALSHGADYPDVHFELGQLHRRAGDRERARRSYGRALELNNRYAAAKEALATLSV